MRHFSAMRYIYKYNTIKAFEQNVGLDWVMDTPYTVTTTRAPAVLIIIV